MAILSSCSFLRISQHKNIKYNTPANGAGVSSANQLALDIYAPKKRAKPHNVFVFIHGGNWKDGSKNQYGFLGKRMAKKGVVTVIIDYRLSADTNYEGMAMDAARALKWVQQNIHSYGGDSNKIYLSGHSAGGHLAALIATDQRFFTALNMKNPIKGVVLNDAFGLDMYTYLSISHKPKDTIYFPTFSSDPENWKKGSPQNYLHKGMPRVLILLGERTHHSIIYGSYSFLAAVRALQPNTRLVLFRHKKHVPMIAMFVNPFNKVYREIFKFMGE